MLEKFIIGTANFGMAYGIMGRGQRLSDGLIREILSLSKNYKVKFLDTAPVYGDSEKIIGKMSGRKRATAWEETSKRSN